MSPRRTRPWKPPHPSAKTPSVNATLRDAGWLPVKWAGTRARLVELGIEVQQRDDAFVAGTGIPGTVGAGPAAGRDGAQVTSWWAPRWAVLVCEAEPCSEAARDWMLTRAVTDTETKQALETIALLADNATARAKMAEYIIEIWEPGG